MINLLPPQQKREILEAENLKLCLILGTLFLFFLISLSLVLLSVKIYISGEAFTQKILVDSEEKKFKVSEAEALEKEIKLINQNLTKLDSFYQGQLNFTALLEETSQMLPQGVYLINFSYTPPSASLRGYAPTRELLSELKKKLEANPNFKDVYFPPSNWIKPRDIEFNTTFQLNL